MPDKGESEDETKQLRSTVLETATSILQIQRRAEQEIRRKNEVLEQRARELAEALVILRATLESTTDAILVTDEKVKVTNFNEKYIDMWKMPREVLERGMGREVRELASQNFADPQRFVTRIEEIVASGQESFDLLELKDGRIFHRYSKVLAVEGKGAGRVWSFREVTERHLAEITSRRLAAIVSSSDDAIIGKDLSSIITGTKKRLVIRPFEAADEGAVISLWYRCKLVRPANDPKKDIKRKLRIAPELFLVGVWDEMIVATVMAGYEGHRGWINYLGVAPEYRRRGWGRLLINEAERLLVNLGCPKVNLQVVSSNVEAVAFYRRLGYVVDEVVSMGKRLEVDNLKSDSGLSG